MEAEAVNLYFISIFRIVLHLIQHDKEKYTGTRVSLPPGLPITESDFYTLARDVIKGWKKLKGKKKYNRIPLTEVFVLFWFNDSPDPDTLEWTILLETEMDAFFRSIEGEQKLH